MIMSENKRKRSMDHYGSQFKCLNETQGQNHVSLTSNPTLQQQIVLNPVIANSEQIIEGEQIQLINGNLQANQNGQSNVVFLVLPSGVNQMNAIQTIPTVLLLPPKNNENESTVNLPELHYYKSESNSEAKGQNQDVIIIKDINANKTDEQEINTELISVAETDPLQLSQFEDVSNSVLVLNSGNLQTFHPVDNSNPPKWKTKFTCDFPGCLISLPSLHEKKLHADSHAFPANTEFKCSICNMIFERAVDRNKHVESHTIVNTYKCKNCKTTFPYYTSLVKHLNEEKCPVDKSFMCNFCGVQFVNAKDLNQHQKFNMKFCVCRAKICSEQAFEMHKNLCAVYKRQAGKSKGNIRRKSKTNPVIVID